MTTRTITLTGARGGQGTTTAAAALALFASRDRPTALVGNDPSSTASLLGVPRADDDDSVEVTRSLQLTTRPPIEEPGIEVVVIDAGTGPAPPQEHAPDEHYVVLRGPCYVALASLLAAQAAPDGIILVAEPGRSLTARDVTEVLGVPVVATLEASPRVARTIDAGLLVSRLNRLRELHDLAALAVDSYAGRQHPSTARPRQTVTITARHHTDLPSPQMRTRAEGSRAVNRVATFPAGGYVNRTWDLLLPGTHVEHRPPRARCRGLLHRRGRHLRRGVLHRQG